VANVATIFVRAEPLDAALTADDLLSAVISPERNSYNVPVWHAAVDGFIDLQYGARWSGVPAPEFIWERYGDRLASLWVRYYNDGGEFDEIAHRTAGMTKTSPWRLCEYHYDSLLLTSRTGAVRRRELGPQQRRAANERDILGEIERDTPTTPATLYAWEKTYWLESWRAYGVPGETMDEVTALAPDLLRAELRWEGRPVEVAERVGPRASHWIRWSLDDWDTCADLDYLLRDE
jgi:hypothetical protein